MEYKVLLSEKSERFLSKMDKENQIRIRNKFRELRFNPKLGKPLTANLSGLWSLRIGKYRALYNIENGKLIVFILSLAYRKNIYDNA